MSPTDRYQPTDAGLADAEPVGDVARVTVLLIVAVIQAVVAVLIASIATSAVPQFNALFESFGAELPAATRFIVANTWLWWAFGLAGPAITVWVVRRRRVPARELRRMKLAVCMFLIVLGAATAFAFFSLYARLFEPGRAA